MGNDNQVKDLLEKTKSIFLPESIRNPDGKPRLYSLEDEYAKSKKNKPFVLYLFVTGFVVLVVVVSIIVISYIQNQNKNIPLEFKDFEDLQLKELIESSRKNENKIEQIKREVTDLEIDYRDRIDRINKEFERLRDELNMKDISVEEKTTRLSSITENKNKKIKTAEDDYMAKRKQKEAEMVEVEKKLAAINSTAKKSNKNLESLFGGEGKLQNLQLKKVSAVYDEKLREIRDENRKEQEELVLLYNPIFKEKYILEVIQKTPVDTKAKDKYFINIDDDIAVENAATKEQIARLADDMKKELAITGRLRQIPYKNSVQKSVVHADSLAKQIFNNYDSIMQKMVESIQGKNQAIRFYSYAFEYMTKAQQENGYILDARDKTKIGVYLSRVHKIKPGDVAYVFRSDDEFIATIRFKAYQGLVVGEVVDLVPGREIRPFDKLMFKMGSEQQ
jgi:hypothetical protein